MAQGPSGELPKQYDHQAAQSRWYRHWEERGYFRSAPDRSKRPFCIVIPPPNVTGALHLGHALNGTLQDILIRQKRMQGFATLWMPGTDHAGIATQAVVERRLLQEEKLSRHELGRAGLVARIWEWKNEYEARILGQLKQMGCSCDWQRTRFTLDPVCARAVRYTFFSLFASGLLYRGKRLVNWDTMLQTAVSDDEVFHETVDGYFWYFQYPVIAPRRGEPTHVTIATTRPETMLGDTAVAVHPDPGAALDQAEQELTARLAAAPAKEREDMERQIDDVRARRATMLPALQTLAAMARDGRMLMLPLMDRPIPLIADAWAKPEMGTGCVKITPAHDPNDYEVGLRQKLPMVNILNVDGTLNAATGQYQGQTVPQARKSVVADLETLGLLVKTEERQIDLAHSDRSKTPIEPLLADQWFVRMEQLAQTAMDAVSETRPAEERVRIIPQRYTKSYLDWLGEKRDWPVSRQLWWGHQIPVWYCKTASEADLLSAFAGRDDVVWQRDEEHGQWLICAREEDLAADAVPGHTLRREEDVLDTWFSSALWPHSTLGWPEATAELAYYYPTAVLITSRDIITLWVARMVLTGLHNVGRIPFHDVYIHPKILDAYGEGMSKSKGNGVDPLDVIEKFGADALRFGLAYLTTETQDIRMPVEFECPHCGKLVEQTRENRMLPKIKCPHCGERFSTQWANKPEDKALPRGAVVSERFELGRNFCNKLWNASRFAMMNLEGYTAGEVPETALRLEDRWLLSRLSTVTANVASMLDEYRYADAARALYDFAWDEFCSFYVEMAKGRLQDPAARPVAQRVLAHALDVLLRLLHPMIPFLTEEVWNLLAHYAPQRGLAANGPWAIYEPAESVMVAPWPAADPSRHDPLIEARFAVFQTVLRDVRDIRSRQSVPPRTELQFAVRCDAATAALLSPMAPYFQSMAGAQLRDCGPLVERPPLSVAVLHASAGAMADGRPGGDMDVIVDLAGLIDVEAEIARKRKEAADLEKFIAAKAKKLENASFVAKAPAEVVQKERDSLEDLKRQLAAALESIAQLAAAR